MPTTYPNYRVVAVVTGPDGEIVSEIPLDGDLTYISYTWPVDGPYGDDLKGTYPAQDGVLTYHFERQDSPDGKWYETDEDPRVPVYATADPEPEATDEPVTETPSVQRKPQIVETVIFWVLVALYKLGFKQFTCRKANKWGGKFSHGRSRRYNAAFRLQKVQSIYPVCAYCTWAILPDDPHPDCEADLCDMAAHAYFADKAETFIEHLFAEGDQVDDRDDSWPEDLGDDGYIDDESLAEFRHGQRHEMY